MSNFYARTRVRGEVDFNKATWMDGYFGGRKYGVRFLEGKHEGEVFHEDQVAIEPQACEKVERNRNE